MYEYRGYGASPSIGAAANNEEKLSEEDEGGASDASGAIDAIDAIKEESFDDEPDEDDALVDGSENADGFDPANSNIELAEDTERAEQAEGEALVASNAAAADTEAKPSMFSKLQKKWFGKDKGDDKGDDEGGDSNADDVGTQSGNESRKPAFLQNMNSGQRFFLLAGACLCLFIVGIILSVLLTAEGSESSSRGSPPRPAPVPIAQMPSPASNVTMEPSSQPNSTIAPQGQQQTTEPPSSTPSADQSNPTSVLIDVEFGIIQPINTGAQQDNSTLREDLIATMDILATQVWNNVDAVTSRLLQHVRLPNHDASTHRRWKRRQKLIEPHSRTLEDRVMGYQEMAGVLVRQGDDSRPSNSVRRGSDSDTNEDRGVPTAPSATSEEETNVSANTRSIRTAVATSSRSLRHPARNSVIKGRRFKIRNSDGAGIDSAAHADGMKSHHARETERRLDDRSAVQLPTQLTILDSTECPQNIFLRDVTCDLVRSTIQLKFATSQDIASSQAIIQSFTDDLHISVDDGTFTSILKSPQVNEDSPLSVFSVAVNVTTQAPTEACSCGGGGDPTDNSANSSKLDCCPSMRPTMQNETAMPSVQPTVSLLPSAQPSSLPSAQPSAGPYQFNQCTPDTECCANGVPNICDRAVNDVLYVTLHNAMASKDEDFLIFPEHEIRLEEALDSGFRGLHLGMCNCDGTYVLCNGDCRQGTRDVEEVFENIGTFLDGNSREVMIVLLELHPNAGEDIRLEDMLAAIDGDSGFGSRLYARDVAGGETGWPTMREAIDDNKRVMMFHYGGDSCDDGCPSGLHFWPEFSANTRDRFSSTGQILANPNFSCEIQLGGDISTYPQSRSFFGVTHHLTQPNINSAQGLNSLEVLNVHADQCSETENGLDVNLMLIDFWHVGDLIEFQQEHNLKLGSSSGMTAEPTPGPTSNPTVPVVPSMPPSSVPSAQPTPRPSAQPSIAPYQFNQCTPETECCANGLPNICDLAVNDVLYVTLHNAMASKDEDFLIFPEHEIRLEEALNSGFRGLHLGMCNCDGNYVLCDGNCRLGTRDVEEVFENIGTFLDGNSREVMIVLLELHPNAGEDIRLEDMVAAIDGDSGSGSDFGSRLYVHDGETGWPTMREAIDDNKRVMMFHYGGESCDNGCPLGLHHWPEFAGFADSAFESAETAFDNSGTSCAVSIGGTVTGSNAVPFYAVSHYVRNPRRNDSAVLNAADKANLRLEQCSFTQNDTTVNLLLVDNWDLGDLVQVQQDYNRGRGLQPSANMSDGM